MGTYSRPPTATIVSPPIIRLQSPSNLILQPTTTQNFHPQQIQRHVYPLSPPPRQSLLSHTVNQHIPMTSTSEIQRSVIQSTSSTVIDTNSLPPAAEESKKGNTKKRNECPFCQIVCAKPSVLDKHIRTHTNERPYPCEPCGFAFKTKSNLYKHKKSRTHNLKIEKGIDSHSEDIVAELGDGVFEERDQIANASYPPISYPHSSLHRVVVTNPTSLTPAQVIVGGSGYPNVPNSSNIRIPTISADTRLPLILTTQGNPPPRLLNTTMQNPGPRFSVHGLRPEQPYGAPAEMYSARPGHFTSQSMTQGSVPQLAAQGESHLPTRGSHPVPTFSRDAAHNILSSNIKQSNSSHDISIASHHRAIAVASLTQVSSSSTASLGAIRNTQTITRPPLTMDPIRVTTINQLHRPPIPSTERPLIHYPPTIVQEIIREPQHQATDLSKAIRSSAASAVRAITQRTNVLTQPLTAHQPLARETSNPSHQYNIPSQQLISKEHPPQHSIVVAKAAPEIAALGSGFTRINSSKSQTTVMPNSAAIPSSPGHGLNASPAFTLTSVGAPHLAPPNDNEPRDLSSKAMAGTKTSALPVVALPSRLPLIALPQQPLPNTLAPVDPASQQMYRPKTDISSRSACKPQQPALPTAPLPIDVSAISSATAAPLLIPHPVMPTDLTTTGSTHSTQSRRHGSEIRIPELQQRIDKVISENQAIVETLDPLWPRRYMRQSSKDKEKETAISLTPTTQLIIEDTKLQQQLSKSRYTNSVKYSASPPVATIQSSPSFPLTLSKSTAAVVLSTLPSSISSIISSSIGSNSIPTPLQLPQQPLSPRHVATASNTADKPNITQESIPQIRTLQSPFTTLSSPPLLPQIPDRILKSMRQQEVASPKESNQPLNLMPSTADPLPGRTRTFSLPAVIPSGSLPDKPLPGNSVKEVLINSFKKPSKNVTGNMAHLEGIASNLETSGAPFHPENPEGSMIKELLLKTRMNAAGLTTTNVGASTLTLTPTDTTTTSSDFDGTMNFSSTRSNSDSQIVIEVQNKSDGVIQPTRALSQKQTPGNVSVILNPSLAPSNAPLSSSIPVPKTKLISHLGHSDIHGGSNITKWIQCPLCSTKFQGIDLAVHQMNHCPMGPNAMKQQKAVEISVEAKVAAFNPISLSNKVDYAEISSKLTLGDNSRSARVRRHSEDALSAQLLETSPPKQLKLSLADGEAPKAIYGRSGGGIVSMTQEDLDKKSDSKTEGLLQIAQPRLFSGGGVYSSNEKSSTTEMANRRCFYDLKNIVSQEAFNIPGIPTPQMSGILTGIKPSTSLFSLPGKSRYFGVSALPDAKKCGEPGITAALTIEPIKIEDESKTDVSESNEIKKVPCVPGIPGPYSQSSSITDLNLASVVNSSSDNAMKEAMASSSSSSTMCEIKVEVSEEDSTFLRPSSLPLTPGTFKTKKHVMLSQSTPGGPGATLVSPETPRPRKAYALQYQNGTAYTYLGLKRSTRVYFCTLSRPQPVYVINKPKLSMYSNWKVVSKDSHPSGLSPSVGLGCYNSSSHPAENGTFTTAKIGMKDPNSTDYGNPSCNMIMTHSSQWKKVRKTSHKSEDDAKKLKDSLSPNRGSSSQTHSPSRPHLSSPRSTMSSSGSENESSSAPDSIRRVEGGYKSREDVKTYVRGRGRGRYVCDSCGIRCKKPSMLKKHAKTHSDMRPYTCRYCNFAFKTKGNLTKHMKSKAHHKKCVEIGISPIPISVEDLESRQGAGEGPSTQQVNIPSISFTTILLFYSSFILYNSISSKLFF